MSDPTEEQLTAAREAGFKNQLQISGANDDTLSALSDKYGPLHEERQGKYDNLSGAITELSKEED